MKNVEALRGEHAFAFSVYVVDAQARCVFKRERSRKGPLDPVWFDWECWEKRKKFIEAVKRMMRNMPVGH